MSTTDDSSSPTPPAPAGALGQTAGRGVALLLASNMAGKVMVVVAQLVLGWILTPTDFGLYAIVMSIAMFIQTFRDGGVRDYLTRRVDDYEQMLGPCFWLSLWINCLVGLALGVAGMVVGLVYSSTGYLKSPGELALLVWIMAASVPLGSAGPVLLARLRIDLRFSTIATWTVLSAVVRYAGQIGMAVAGFGVYSLIVPLVAVAIFESLYVVAATGIRPWKYKAERSRWKEILSGSGWLMVGQSMAGILNSGYFLLAGLFVPREIIGVLYFAVMLHMQVETLIGQSVVGVMQPVLTRLNGDVVRQGQACLRIARAATLISAPATLGLALLYPAVEAVVFGGKWADAAMPLAVLALGYVARASFVSVPSPLLVARGEYRAWAMMWGWNCAGVLLMAMASAAAAKAAGVHEMAIVSAGVSAFLVVACLWSTVGVMRTLGVSATETLRACIGTLPVTLAAAVACWAADVFVLEPKLGGMITQVVKVAGREVAVFQLVRGAVLGVMFVILLAIGLRVLARAQVADAIGVLPGKLGRPLGRLMGAR